MNVMIHILQAVIIRYVYHDQSTTPMIRYLSFPFRIPVPPQGRNWNGRKRNGTADPESQNQNPNPNRGIEDGTREKILYSKI